MIYILGAGGHARVVRDAIGRGAEAKFVMPEGEYAIPPDGPIAIGVGDIEKRVNIFGRYDLERLIPVVHESVVMADDTIINMGTQIMAGAIIQPGCIIGANAIINTGAQVDHDCDIGAHCHVAPGAILCGGVMLGERCFIGAGAVIVQGVVLDGDTYVPAASLVAGPDDIRRPSGPIRDRAVPPSFEA